MTDDDYIGSVSLTAISYAPQGTAMCWGQIMSIAQNDALFSLVGNLYGGDGVSSFGLPDLRGTVPIGAGAQATTGRPWEQGEMVGNLTELSWPSGNPAAAQSGDTPTLPTAAGPSGLALNWAIALYGLYPPRD